MLRLLDLVIRPFPVEAKHRYSILIDNSRIDLTVTVVIGDHFTTAGEADHRPPKPAIVVLEICAVATGAVITLDTGHESEGRRCAAAAAKFDVISAREVELLIVKPPRHVEVHAADSIFVMRYGVGHLGNK